MVTRPSTTWYDLARHEDPPAPDPTPDPQDGATPPADPPADPVPDDLGESGRRALAAERQARRDAEARARANEDAARRLKEIEDAEKTEIQRLEESKTAAEEDAKTARTEATRLRVMAAEGIDPELEEFLTATDEDSLRAQAVKLKERLAAQAPRVPIPDPGQGTKTPPGEVDMRNATKAERDAALRKIGVRSF